MARPFITEHGSAQMVRNRRCWPACHPCFWAYKQQMNRHAMQRDSGRTSPAVNPWAAAAMITEMFDDYGVQLTAMEAQTGLSRRHLRVIRDGQCDQIRRRTEQKIARLYRRVTAAPPGDRELKSNLRKAQTSMDAVRGLMAQGWPGNWIAAELKTKPQCVSRLSLGQQRYVHAVTEDRIVALVRRIGNDTGPGVRTQRMAQRRGWKPTIWYDALV